MNAVLIVLLCKYIRNGLVMHFTVRLSQPKLSVRCGEVPVCNIIFLIKRLFIQMILQHRHNNNFDFD